MPQHPLFIKYKREWLSKMTGYSKGYLCRMATGSQPLSRSFIERVCFKLATFVVPQSKRGRKPVMPLIAQVAGAR